MKFVRIFLEITLLISFAATFSGVTGCGDNTPPGASLSVENGEVLLILDSQIPVQKVEVFSSKNMKDPVWSASSLEKSGVFIPMEGSSAFRLGLPSVDCEMMDAVAQCHPKKFWSFREINTQDVFKSGETYQVLIHYSGYTKTSTTGFTHQRRDDRFVPLWSEPFKTQDYYLIGDRYRASHFYEYQQHRVMFSAQTKGVSPYPMGYLALDENHVSQRMPHYPMNPGFFAVSSTDSFALNMASPASKPLIAESGAPIIAAMMNDDRSSIPASIKVLEGKPYKLNFQDTPVSWESQWSALGSVPGSYRGYHFSVPALVSGFVKNMKPNQHQQRPLFLTAQDAPSPRYNADDPQQFEVFYYASDSTWRPMSKVGLAPTGTTVIAMDLAITKSGKLIGCQQIINGTIVLSEFSASTQKWNTLATTNASFPRGDVEYSRSCKLSVEGDVVVAVGYLASPFGKLWIQKVDENGTVTSIDFNPALTVKTDPSWYLPGEGTETTRVGRVGDVRIVGGDLYIAFDDFAGVFAFVDFWPYSRSTHLVKYNGEEWVRIRSSAYPVNPEFMGDPKDISLSPGDVGIAQRISEKGTTLLYGGGRSIGIDQNWFYSLMAWELK